MQLADYGYSVDSFGIIHENSPVTVKYDLEYVSSRYDTIPELVTNMSYLRAGYIKGTVPHEVVNLLDVGYGNGAFLKAMSKDHINCYGTDISGYAIPEGCTFIEFDDALNRGWDLVTFYDSLEHIQDLSFLKRLKAHSMVVSAPWCNYRPGCDIENDFIRWKHRRPGEHLHHFHPFALDNMFESLGYKCVALGTPEDLIRGKTPNGDPNIFTAVFTKG